VEEHGTKSLAASGWYVHLQLLEATFVEKEALVCIDRTQEPVITKDRQPFGS